MAKKLISIGVLASALCGLAVYAAQDTALEQKEVRDPRQLETYLEANATDAQTRLAALEGSLGTNATLGVTVGALTTTGAVTIGEGKIADSTIVSADIKDGAITNTDIAATAQIAGTQLSTAVQASLAKADTAVQPFGTNVIAGGYFYVSDTTQLVWIAGVVTNVIDADITN